ncbi:hypothetical protein GXB85_01620 [Cellulomonas sp. APG4]|uniref:DUF5709 domain-containing protein n=1 Tax=Cellulomonas sp. APG4 TaxID=1538656 RepID=UPI00137B0C15|nr:DUF5709 domain-containing protein [Cellulomonas sp. APG4]NCT89658.1 hypothetical protein [Cellulomonas sp. APG4]
MSTDDGDTPATSPAPEQVAEGDTNQLDAQETLVDRGTEDVLDEGYVPPDRPPNPHRLETEVEQLEGENLDERLAQEEPEVWEAEGPAAGAREPDRAGRLAADSTEASGDTATSLMAVDEGISGGAASAEEAAVHVLDEDR